MLSAVPISDSYWAEPVPVTFSGHDLTPRKEQCLTTEMRIIVYYGSKFLPGQIYTLYEDQITHVMRTIGIIVIMTASLLL